ncbi:hypothetical protein J7L70_07625 [Candidatus Bathyarchaeota archaeon]|nr:hypothetical protein [Candidatus Bathyarchaeota archaeon]
MVHRPVALLLSELQKPLLNEVGDDHPCILRLNGSSMNDFDRLYLNKNFCREFEWCGRGGYASGNLKTDRIDWWQADLTIYV